MKRAVIFYNLSDSFFTFTIRGIKYYFSSKFHLEKFTELVEEAKEEVDWSLTKRFGFPVNCGVISDIRLYQRVENRGFLIETPFDGRKYGCVKDIKLSGVKVIVKNSQKPCENLTPNGQD